MNRAQGLDTGEVEYRFKHGLAQETVYLSMLPEKRRWLHLKIAHAIEAIYQEKIYEFYGILSYHFSKGEDFDKAESYMILAGTQITYLQFESSSLDICSIT